MAMKKEHVLIYDDSEVYTPIKSYLEHRDYIVDATFDEHEARRRYETCQYKFVLVNFMVHKGFRFMQELLEQNPSQRMVTISTTWECSDPLGCSNCIRNYNKKRLMMPNDLRKLVPLLENFDDVQCEYAFKVSQHEAIV